MRSKFTNGEADTKVKSFQFFSRIKILTFCSCHVLQLFLPFEIRMQYAAANFYRRFDQMLRRWILYLLLAAYLRMVGRDLEKNEGTRLEQKIQKLKDPLAARALQGNG